MPCVIPGRVHGDVVAAGRVHKAVAPFLDGGGQVVPRQTLREHERLEGIDADYCSPPDPRLIGVRHVLCEAHSSCDA